MIQILVYVQMVIMNLILNLIVYNVIINVVLAWMVTVVKPVVIQIVGIKAIVVYVKHNILNNLEI